LSSSKSKSNLIKFLTQDWQKQSLRVKLRNKVMYVTRERKCFRVTEDAWSEVESLYSTQEEANTRILLHAKHAEEESTAVIIASQDTDVFIISLSFAHEFACQLYVKSGTQTREKFKRFCRKREDQHFQAYAEKQEVPRCIYPAGKRMVSAKRPLQRAPRVYL